MQTKTLHAGEINRRDNIHYRNLRCLWCCLIDNINREVIFLHRVLVAMVTGLQNILADAVDLYLPWKILNSDIS